MAFQIDPNIPLQAGKVQFDPASILMQAQQNSAALEKHRFEMQKLREDYDLAKEQRKQQKAMQMGIASDLARIQSGTPAQYNTTFPQTMPTGQMPQGMTGVLANERGQNMPQPALFGENILQGDFDVNREVVSPAIAPKQPDIKDVLTAQFNAAMAAQDVETAFDAAKKLKELEKNPAKYFGGLTKGVDPKTNKPLFLAMTESGVVPVDGYQPYEEPKAPKTSLITTSQGYEVVKEGELPKGAPVKPQAQPKSPQLKEITGLDGSVNIVNMATGEITPVLANGKPFIAKDDPLTLFTKKEEFKAELKQRETVAQKYADASDVIPLLDGYIADLEKTPSNLLAPGYSK